MTLLELLKNSEAYTKSGGRYVGPCPKCGGSSDTTRFVTRIGSETGKCFSCGWGTDTVRYLREIEGYTCPNAHRQLNKECTSSSCPARSKCSLGKGGVPGSSCAMDTPCVASGNPTARHPAPASDPAQQWQQKAAALVQYAHEKLLADEKCLAYLAGRGLPLDCVVKYRLGYLSTFLCRPRSSWGLPEELNADQKPKPLFFPAGIVIPWFINGEIHRIRIRKENLRNSKDARYYWLPGSGNDVICLNPAAAAHVVVESDLDGLLIDWHAGDLVGTIPLGTCSADPKATALASLEKSVRILVSLDFDAPKIQEATGETIIPGGKAALKWLKLFPRTARRWPVPLGKDPGEAYQAGVDIRRWVMDGLPPAMKVAPGKVEKMEKKKPQFDAEKAHRLINDAYSLIASQCPAGAMEWLELKRPDLIASLKREEASIDNAFESEDLGALSLVLTEWSRGHAEAFEIFNTRPPVIEVQETLFQ